MDELDIAARDGLPADLRLLADRYPRDSWTGHRNFDGLTAFWLDRHGMFRKLQARLQAEAASFLDGKAAPRAFGGAVHRLAGLYLNELHGHHRIEDVHYFPLLTAKEPRLERGFALLDRDHHALDAQLHALAEDTNRLLRAIAGGAPAHDAAGAFHTRVHGFAGFLDRHLTDEEDIVVPVILEHGSAGLG